ncbi:hypothetical protein RhiirA1_453029 [Rhizophagus irregularis]|uniref:Uncharacterized protein n=1 Tax=Rhizophagus irregularis TaxID=588596 RepID=A0A2N0S8L7_9GLOM|nr:hypothetical protein RhiirA1_453029 [Rhizophagus irregularis]
METWQDDDKTYFHNIVYLLDHEILDIEDFETDHKALTVKVELKEKIGMNKSGYMKTEEVELRLEDLDRATTQRLDRENTWKMIVEIYDEEKNRQITEIRNKKEKLKKERDECTTRTNEEHW